MDMQQLDTPDGRLRIASAWTDAEVGQTVRALIDVFADCLPEDPAARIVIKPNLNNDLVALTGNCADLRVLAAICEGLQERGFTHITIADGSNVGVERRGIDAMGRLRIDRLCERLGVGMVDLNKDEGTPVQLHDGAHPRIAKTILDADCLISVPTMKTHVEMGISCSMKNWVGICTGQDKRHMHYNLGLNIFALSQKVVPHLIIVDGLVGMEGNGPGDGEPFRLGTLMASDSMPLCDVAACHLVRMPIEKVEYLVHAREAGVVTPEMEEVVTQSIEPRHTIKPAPIRSSLAVLSESRSLGWLKRLARPLTQHKVVLEAAYKLKVVQDVYDLQDDAIEGISRNKDLCSECGKCVDFCPTHLPLEDIGVKTQMPDCIGCMYCWWVCQDDAIVLNGTAHAMTRQIERYKKVIETL